MRTFHLTFSALGRQPLFPAESARRSAVRALVRVAGPVITLFCLVDDHAHVVVLCEPASVSRVARSIHMTLTAHASVPVLPAHIEPVERRGHMEWLVDYAITQVDHHALHAHPALWSGSCFADLVGARVLDGWRRNLSEALPRFSVAHAMEAAGLKGHDASPLADGPLRALGVQRIVDAASAAAGADPALAGRPDPVVAARRAAIHLARAAGIGPTDIGEALAISSRAVFLLAEKAPPAAHVAATRVRLGLEVALAERGVSISGERPRVAGRQG